MSCICVTLKPAYCSLEDNLSILHVSGWGYKIAHICVCVCLRVSTLTAEPNGLPTQNSDERCTLIISRSSLRLGLYSRDQTRATAFKLSEELLGILLIIYHSYPCSSPKDMQLKSLWSFFSSTFSYPVKVKVIIGQNSL